MIVRNAKNLFKSVKNTFEMIAFKSVQCLPMRPQIRKALQAEKERIQKSKLHLFSDKDD